MRLQVQGRVQTGVETFDHALDATTIWQDAPGGPLLVASSGQQGGISTWRLLPSGHVVALDTLAYSATGTRAARDHAVLVPFRDEMVAFYGLGDTTFWGQVVNPDGSFGARRLVNFDTASTEIAAGNAEFLQLWALMRPDAPPGLPDLPSWQGTTGLAQTGRDLLVTSATEAGLRMISPSGASILAGSDMGIMAPTGLAVFGSGAETRIVVAGAGGSSLSVLRAAPDGYVPTDHRLDTGHSALARVQAVAGVTIPTANGPLDLVLAGGGDHGVSVFVVTSDGFLIWLDTVFDTALTGLHNVATLTATLVGGHVIVTATSQRDPGITVLTLPLAGFGGVAPAGRGGGGADIVIATPGVTTVTGGAGADIFVIRSQDSRITITDFTPGQDRLDLSAWPMLRDISQLSFQPVTGGGLIRYRGYEVQVLSATARMLSLSDIFPQGLAGTDRAMVLDSPALFGALPPPSPPVVEDAVRRFIGTDGPDLLRGSGGRDLLNGGAGHDTLRGEDGNDTIHGGAGDDNIGGGAGHDQIFGVAGANIIWGGLGDDTVQGGSGNDTIHGGGTGSNQLFGHDGDDLIFAGGGGDFIGGGAGHDIVRGSVGNDTIYGGTGNDNLAGGAGDDVIFAATGANTIWGGLGDDTLHGGFGRDVMNGGPGADTFVFASGAQIGIAAGRDVISDFTSGEDRIDLTALTTLFNGSAGVLGGGQASFFYFAAGGLLIGDQTGNGAADWVLELAGAPTIGAGDFLL